VRTLTATARQLSLALALIVGPACGGGGGGGGGSGGGPTNPQGIAFSAASAAGSDSCFLAEGGQTNAGRLFLEVRVNAVDDWYGVAFDLLYPSGQLDFEVAREGGFPGGSTALEVAEVAPGQLVVGHTRLGNTSGRSGSGTLMTLEFSPVANGSGAISFQNAQAFRTNSFPQAATFIGGTVSVSR
jgi:hypothetical protein